MRSSVKIGQRMGEQEKILGRTYIMPGTRHQYQSTKNLDYVETIFLRRPQKSCRKGSGFNEGAP